MGHLKVWYSEAAGEWVVAFDEIDAFAAWADHNGLDDVERGSPEAPRFVELNGDEKLSINVDDEGSICDCEEGEPLELTAKEWAEREGRGWLCREG